MLQRMTAIAHPVGHLTGGVGGARIGSELAASLGRGECEWRVGAGHGTIVEDGADGGTGLIGVERQRDFAGEWFSVEWRSRCHAVAFDGAVTSHSTECAGGCTLDVNE
jgi:hypothetical protein